MMMTMMVGVGYWLKMKNKTMNIGIVLFVILCLTLKGSKVMSRVWCCGSNI